MCLEHVDASIKQAAVLVGFMCSEDWALPFTAGFHKMFSLDALLLFSLLLTSLILPSIYIAGMYKLLSHLKLKGIYLVPTSRTTLPPCPWSLLSRCFSFNFCHILEFFFFPSHHQWFHFFKKLLPSSTQCWLDYKQGSAFTALDRVQWRVAANGTSSGELWSAFMGKRRDLRCRACQWALCLDPSFAWDGVCQILAGMTPDLRRPGWEQSDVPHLLIMA